MAGEQGKSPPASREGCRAGSSDRLGERRTEEMAHGEGSKQEDPARRREEEAARASQARARREMDERLPWERRSVQRKEKERVGKR
ncbi:hypothetical protein Zm00014a_021646 [Zea mays]|jgi:hypothetical protein|uniref:Uncharacterized protein n=2 Tax=Zea mays TaxID=4577 RepID=A0A1D6FJK8_MAIZE|nr:hypothetical protein ZEAMMB73_Zm00001d009459 [Zea mays]PWZ11673.1 hypothetical protein Zm00014a_021646 [Zea mays]